MLRLPLAITAVTFFGVLALVAVGCQTYDFEPVTPLTLAQTTMVEARAAKKLKPNIMLLVDSSGSMAEPINPNGPNCTPGCGTSSQCPPGCATRMSDLRSAMSAFLTTRGTIARMGLTFFPGGPQCTTTSMTTVDLPPKADSDDGTDAALQAKATSINSEIATRTPLGGTPTAAALDFVGRIGTFGDPNREDFILLLTDGLPNCNSQNPHNDGCVPNGNCHCTTAAVCPASSCPIGCLDQDATVAQIAALRTRGIRTVVVGFGAETNMGDAPDTLQAMAEAGDFGPRCLKGTDAECVGSTCDTVHLKCRRQFYQASNRAELEKALEAISAALVKDPCEFVLEEEPSDPRFIAVLVDGVDVPPGPTSWSYDTAGHKVVFAAGSTYCARLTASTPVNRVKVEIRIIQRL